MPVQRGDLEGGAAKARQRGDHHSSVGMVWLAKPGSVLGRRSEFGLQSLDRIAQRDPRCAECGHQWPDAMGLRHRRLLCSTIARMLYPLGTVRRSDSNHVVSRAWDTQSLGVWEDCISNRQILHETARKPNAVFGSAER